MKKLYSLIIMAVAIFSTAYAQTQLTVTCEDTGEAFEVLVPNGLRISEYNSDWLDSIPYLLERASYGEPWAYEALGDCYRYGKGGVEQSIMKSCAYYSLSGKDIDTMAIQLAKDNPLDHLALVYKLFGKVENNDKEGVLCILDTLNEEGYHHADVLRDFLGNTSLDSLANLLERNIMSSKIGIDETIFTVFGAIVRNCSSAIKQGNDEILKSLSSKFPYIYDYLAMRFFKGNHEDMDSETYAEKRAKAMDFLLKADNEAFLSREGAKILYDYYNSEFEAGRIVLDISYMERLATLARLHEAEKSIFNDN